jgi:hypothetical protein
MTIFRSNLVDAERLEFQFVSSNDPDLIGVEVMFDGNVLIDVSMDEGRQTSVLFDTDGVNSNLTLRRFGLCWTSAKPNFRLGANG